MQKTPILYKIDEYIFFLLINSKRINIVIIMVQFSKEQESELNLWCLEGKIRDTILKQTKEHNEIEYIYISEYIQSHIYI